MLPTQLKEIIEASINPLLFSTKGQYDLAIIPEAREFLFALLLDKPKLSQTIVWVAADKTEAQQIFGRLISWISILDLGQSSKSALGLATSNGFESLTRLARGKLKLVITSCDTFSEQVPTPFELQHTSFELRIGDKWPLAKLYERFLEMGYQPVDMVTDVNQIAKRGGIIDLYIARFDYPLRIEFWGDEISSLRLFDPRDQRSLSSEHNKVSEIHIPTLNPQNFSGSMWDYVQNDSILLGEAETLAQINPPAQACIWRFGGEEEKADIAFDCMPLASVRGQMKQYFKLLLDQLDSSKQVFVISNQAKRLKEMLAESRERIYGTLFTGREKALTRVSYIDLSQDIYPIPGFSSSRLGLAVLSDYEIFGLVQAHTQTVGYLKRKYKHFLNTIEKEDIVVHSDYGLCVLKDVLQMEAASIEREYFLLKFAGKDKLYLPTSQVYKLSKYLGKDKDQVNLDRLGGKRWKKERKRAELDTHRLAEDLLALYARRQATRGFAFAADDYVQKEIENSFPYLETTDQLRAIHEVKQDMEMPKPMDRLICGDVGFGKTEVAVRAAAKAVLGGKQVAFLCPTTILAEQHYETFEKRLHTYGMKIGLLSRFRKASQNTKTIENLAKGKIDIVIGTHRLLSRDVRYHDLGLLIIDEEQRFGVRHKEKVKTLRASLDVLALSATPIPRTLNLSLLGIRDISLITTPPKGRLPIKTFVMPYADHIVRDAITNELQRKGQTFIVYNRVKSIDHFAEKVAKLLPQARIAVSHGQLDSKELEEKMYSFVTGKIDVLVSSTIIENGVDIASANTMIVIGAEDFGLASLYQLRGRVGRSDTKAYTYFLSRRDKLSSEAQKRLRAIKEASELGAGLSLALRDLEIRGVGNILGLEQSGHIDGIGFELYSQLLKKAIDEQKKVFDSDVHSSSSSVHIPTLTVSEVTVDLPLSAFLPENYIGNSREKMDIYQRMSELETSDEIIEMSLELIDRFGQMPTEVSNLMTILKLRILATRLSIVKIGIQDGILFYTFNNVIPSGVRNKLLAIQPDWKFEAKTARILFKKMGTAWLTQIERSLI